MSRLGVEQLSALGLMPLEFVDLVPLREYLSAVPTDVVVSLEVPSRTLAKAGLSPRNHLERCVRAARALLNP